MGMGASSIATGSKQRSSPAVDDRTQPNLLRYLALAPPVTLLHTSCAHSEIVAALTFLITCDGRRATGIPARGTVSNPRNPWFFGVFVGLVFAQPGGAGGCFGQAHRPALLPSEKAA